MCLLYCKPHSESVKINCCSIRWLEGAKLNNVPVMSLICSYTKIDNQLPQTVSLSLKVNYLSHWQYIMIINILALCWSQYSLIWPFRLSILVVINSLNYECTINNDSRHAATYNVIIVLTYIPTFHFGIPSYYGHSSYIPYLDPFQCLNC